MCRLGTVISNRYQFWYNRLSRILFDLGKEEDVEGLLTHEDSMNEDPNAEDEVDDSNEGSSGEEGKIFQIYSKAFLYQKSFILKSRP